MTKPNWHACKTNTDSPHEQGLIIDDENGANIAVTYDPKHAPLIKHRVNKFDELVEVLEEVKRLTEIFSESSLLFGVVNKLAATALNSAIYRPEEA